MLRGDKRYILSWKETVLTVSFLLLVANFFIVPQASAEFDTVATSTINFNGQVKAIQVDEVNHKAYLGGSFTYAGPYTGGGVVVDPLTGLVSGVMPKVRGVVKVSIADGQGGWYLGGDFTAIGDTQINRLAHISSNGTVDQSFTPNPNGPVFSLLLSGNNLFVGGHFSVLAGVATTNFGAVHKTTGTALTQFYFNFTQTPSNYSYGGVSSDHGNFGVSGGVVKALALSGDHLYIGGIFDNISGSFGSINRQSLAELNIATNEFTVYDPQLFYYFDNNPEMLLPGMVNVLKIFNGYLFVGGYFRTIYGGELPNGGNFMSINLNDDMLATDYGQPSTVCVVNAIEANESAEFVYFGGKGCFYFVDLTIPAVSDLSYINMSRGYNVSALERVGNILYIAGLFRKMANDNSFYASSFQAIDLNTGQPYGQDIIFGNQVNTLSSSGGQLFVGGYFTSAGGQSRRRLASIDTLTGQLTSFNPNIFGSGAVTSLLLDAQTDMLFVGGVF